MGKQYIEVVPAIITSYTLYVSAKVISPMPFTSTHTVNIGLSSKNMTMCWIAKRMFGSSTRASRLI